MLGGSASKQGLRNCSFLQSVFDNIRFTKEPESREHECATADGNADLEGSRTERPNGAGFGNIFMRSIIGMVVAELATSSHWQKLPDNIKAETVSKLKEPYRGSGCTLYTESDVQQLMVNTGRACGNACTEWRRSREDQSSR